MIELQGKFGKDCKIFANTIENEAIGTIQNILNNPVTTGVPDVYKRQQVLKQLVF